MLCFFPADRGPRCSFFEQGRRLLLLGRWLLFGLTGACFLVHGDGSSIMDSLPPKFVLSFFSSPVDLSLSFYQQLYFLFLFFLLSVSFVFLCSRLRFSFQFGFLFVRHTCFRARNTPSLYFFYTSFTVSSHAEMLVVSFIIPGLYLGQFHRIYEDDTICHNVVVEYPDTEKFNDGVCSVLLQVDHYGRRHDHSPHTRVSF